MRVNETCSCGARITVEDSFASPVTNAAKDWREGHRCRPDVPETRSEAPLAGEQSEVAPGEGDEPEPLSAADWERARCVRMLTYYADHLHRRFQRTAGPASESWAPAHLAGFRAAIQMLGGHHHASWNYDLWPPLDSLNAADGNDGPCLHPYANGMVAPGSVWRDAVCELPIGHEGDHRATDGPNNIATWANRDQP